VSILAITLLLSWLVSRYVRPGRGASPASLPAEQN
jgi:hypothetical protein